jgi:hypothetical protein
VALLPVDPAAAQRAPCEAYAAFGDDHRGRLLAALEPDRRALADPLVDAQVLASGAAALLFDLGHPLLAKWAEAAERLLPLALPPAQNSLVSFLVTEYIWHGELASCRVLLHHAVRTAAADDPLFAVTRHIWSAVLGFLSADHDRALASIESGQQLARDTGLMFLLPQLYGQETYTALSQGDLARAARLRCAAGRLRRCRGPCRRAPQQRPARSRGRRPCRSPAPGACQRPVQRPSVLGSRDR